MTSGITKGIELRTLYKAAAEAWYRSDVSINHMKLQAEKILNLAFVTATKCGLRIVDNNTRDECSLVLEGSPEFIALSDAVLDAILMKSS